MNDLFDIIFSAGFGYSVIRVTTPILFAALGSLIADKAGVINIALEGTMLVSALTGEGLPMLRDWLLSTAGWRPTGEGVFLARTRHLVALDAARTHLDAAAELTSQYELFAEELRLAQMALASITGEFTPDDLLGEIFGKLCIGK